MTFQTYMKAKPPRVVVLVNGEEVRTHEWKKYGVMPADIEWAKRRGKQIFGVNGQRVEVTYKEQK